jgi:hypothetical protein
MYNDDRLPSLNETLNSLPSIDKKIEALRACSSQIVEHLVTTEIPQDCLPLEYLRSLSNEEKTTCYRAAMICWMVTGSMIVPREMQFRAVLSEAHLLHGSMSA